MPSTEEERRKKNMTRSDGGIEDLINIRKAHDEPVSELKDEKARRAIERSAITDWPDNF